MSDNVERQKRKALLLRQIQQQRLDLSASRRDWIDATRPLDRGWNTFLNLRTWTLAGTSIMTRSASSVNALSLAISFSFRKFEHTRQNIWLTMKRPYLYHCFSVKRGQVYDYDKNS